MRRRTISEKNEDEENDNSHRLSGVLIAEYGNLSSSNEPNSFDDGDFIDRRPRHDIQDSDDELQSLNQQSRSNLSVQARPNLGVADLDSRTGKERHKADFISTGNRLNDMSRLDDYQSRRENNKVNINSFLNSYGDMSSCMEDRIRLFSRDTKKPKPKPFVLVPQPQQAKPIQLITIPEVDPEAAQFEYLSYLNRHRKIKGRDEYFQNLIRYNKHLQRCEDATSTSFSDAKYKFYDRFMPQNQKISKNPYKLLQYNQSNKQWRQMLDRLG